MRNRPESLMATRKGTNDNDKIDGTPEADDLFGYKGKDKIYGGGGDDFIVGHEGKDQLWGGPGADTFVFALKSDLKPENVDKIMDFNPAEGDTILLSYKVFKHMGFGELKEEFFHVGKKAADKDDHIIFNDKTGALYYDPDGKGGEHQVQFAGCSLSHELPDIIRIYLSELLKHDIGLPM
jgi:serralysin